MVFLLDISLFSQGGHLPFRIFEIESFTEVECLSTVVIWINGIVGLIIIIAFVMSIVLVFLNLAPLVGM